MANTLTTAQQLQLLQNAGILAQSSPPEHDPNGWVELAPGIYVGRVAPGTTTSSTDGMTNAQWAFATSVVSPYISVYAIADQAKSLGIDLKGTALENPQQAAQQPVPQGSPANPSTPAPAPTQGSSGQAPNPQ